MKVTTERPASSIPSASAAEGFPFPKILLVDDQPARLLTYEAVLEGIGVSCTRAHSGLAALELLLKETFAVIVLDVNMPEMDGFETARRIREHPRFEHTPIIFVTGVNVSDLDRLRGYEVGAIDYIPLPIVPEIFRSKVALLVELFKRRSELQRLNRELETARVQLEAERNDAVSLNHRLEQQSALERQRIETRSAALLRLTDRFRALTDPADLAFAAAEILGETLAVSRCGYGTIDRDAETISIERDWNAPGIASIAGVLHFREYGTYIDELKRGETVVCVDALTDPRTAETAAALRRIQVQSFVNMPIIERQDAVALLYLNHDRARAWPEEELAFIRDVAERTRIAVERRRNEQALASDLQCMGRLRDLSAKLVTEEDPQILFDEILSTAMFIARSDGGTIQLLDPVSRELGFAASRGLDPELLARFDRVNASSGSSCGQALASNQRIVIGFDPGDGEDADGSRESHRSFGFRRAQSTPLVSRTGRIIGMFSTHWRDRRVLKEQEHRFLDLLARQAADLIERQEVERAMRDADRRKNEFIAILSHEIRNPLVPVRNGISLLKRVPDPDGTLAKIQPMMERQIEHTVRLIDDLLDVSRITSGRITLNRAAVTLDSIVSSALEAHRDQIVANDLGLRVEVGEPRRMVTVDPTRTTQVLSNLLSNAVKYTPRGGHIAILGSFSGVETEPPQLVLEVRDDGVGVSAERMPHIFELFGSTSSRPEDRSSRSGLSVGLALSRRIAEMHGGTLTAFSEGDGCGSRFVLRLPMTPLEPAQPTGHTGRTDPLAGVRVLVVDDDADGADSMVLVLRSMGLTVEYAYDGPSALASAAKFRPQFVLLDTGMPEMDGHETCRRLRALHGDAMRIVALTGWGQEHDKQYAREAGFDAHVTKPADPEALAAALFGTE